MSKTDVFGINEDKLDILITDINDAVTRINNKFDLIERLVSETESYFNCDSGTAFRNKFNAIRSNFAVVDKNIINMSSDLVKVKSRLHAVEEDVNQEFQKATHDIVSNSLEKYKRNN